MMLMFFLPVFNHSLLLVLAQVAAQEVLETVRGVGAGHVGGLVGRGGLVRGDDGGGGGGLGTTQAAVVINLRIAVGMGQDDAVWTIGLGWRRYVDGRGELSTAGVEGVAVGCGRGLDDGWGLDDGRGLGLDVHGDAVLIIVHVAVVAIPGLAVDPEPVADLID